jgi:uroporphyrinogen III methyltransferase / synthase
VGEVVRLRERLNWFEGKPLFGRTVVVTRAREQASDFKALLVQWGAHCIEFPTIAIQPPGSWEPLDQAIARLASYHWLIFTSVNGVVYFLERLHTLGVDIRELKGIRLAAIGPKTAEALENRGLRLDLVPREYRAEAILEALGADGVRGQRMLLPRAMEARDILPDTLRQWGAEVDVVPAYQSVLPDHETSRVLEALRAGEVDCVTFTSSSTVTNFLRMFARDKILSAMEGVAIACIGPITAETAQKQGLTVRIMPTDYTIPALASAVRDHFAQRPRRSPFRG